MVEMNLNGVKDFLAKNELQHPELAVLAASIEEYSVVLYQPKDDVTATAQRIGNKDQPSAAAKCRKLLHYAAREQVQLLVTPEYSLPWSALTEAIHADDSPGAGCIWALGCESLTVGELDQLAMSLAGKARVLFETFDRAAAATKHFLDPLAYVFRTKDKAGQECLVVLIQFKTHPCVDAEHIEIDHLFCGTSILVFGDIGHTIRLVSFMCSDVLELKKEHLVDIYEAAVVLHIQLNPKPRESTYRDYRKQLFGIAGDRTELICLNWAARIREWKTEQGPPQEWNNIGGSAWYLRPTKFDCSDERIAKNHRSGLYYTWHGSSKCHSLFFNYEPAVYRLKATKAWHHGVSQVQSKRSGPRLESVLRWKPMTSEWGPADTLDDGFSNLVLPWSADTGPLSKLHAKCPIATERLLALLQGKLVRPGDWYNVTELATFTINESEFIRRITFAQGLEPDCVTHREDQIRHFVTCSQVFSAYTLWPPELDDLKAGYEFLWEAQAPHCSVRSSSGRYATLVFLGDNPAVHQLRAIGDVLRTALVRSGHEPDRLGIFHRQNGQVALWRHPDSRRYDQPGNASPASFTEGL